MLIIIRYHRLCIVFVVFSAARELGKYVLSFHSPGNTKSSEVIKKKSGPKTETHVDIIQLSSIELSLDLKRNPNGLRDAALVDVSRNEFDHDNPGLSLSDSD